MPTRFLKGDRLVERLNAELAFARSKVEMFETLLRNTGFLAESEKDAQARWQQTEKVLREAASRLSSPEGTTENSSRSPYALGLSSPSSAPAATPSETERSWMCVKEYSSGTRVAWPGTTSHGSNPYPSSAPAATPLKEFRFGQTLAEELAGQVNEPPDEPASPRVSAASQPAQTWQPIETAPRDGKPILIWDGDYAVAWAVSYGGWWSGHSSHPDAKFWMPLPAPPGPVAQEKDSG